jgi:hypothetical protein
VEIELRTFEFFRGSAKPHRKFFMALAGMEPEKRFMPTHGIFPPPLPKDK